MAPGNHARSKTSTKAGLTTERSESQSLWSIMAAAVTTRLFDVMDL